MTPVLAPLVLLANGLTAGVMFSTVIGLVPWTMTLPYERYVQAIQFLWPRYDPFMPIVNVLTVIADILLAVTAPEAASRFLYGTAATLLTVVMAISVIKNVPINKYVISLDPAARPDDWGERDPRRSWRAWNLARTLIALLALGTNAVATATLI
ncbi:anthrone oxygenase family protein [Nonomuraea sp. NPDC059007]|uniref:anthrone oxygenase family protein n=1 Tax=Nonomuraea sp. NPDC059007 TaxID=3346692 RepID=UPI0036CA2C43